MADQVERVAVYIDGYNFYYGLMEAGLGHLRWLDFYALAERLNTTRQLVSTRYYTARVIGDQDAADRQSVFLDALSHHRPHVFKVVEGRLQMEPKRCRADCGKEFDLPVEKHTDVNLATDMLEGAFNNWYDTAMLISGDADQVAAIKLIRKTGRCVRVVFPPERESSYLKAVANTAYPMNRDFLAACQLPEKIATNSGFHLQRPASWATPHGTGNRAP